MGIIFAIYKFVIPVILELGWMIWRINRGMHAGMSKFPVEINRKEEKAGFSSKEGYKEWFWMFLGCTLMWKKRKVDPVIQRRLIRKRDFRVFLDQETVQFGHGICVRTSTGRPGSHESRLRKRGHYVTLMTSEKLHPTPHAPFSTHFYHPIHRILVSVISLQDWVRCMPHNAHCIGRNFSWH